MLNEIKVDMPVWDLLFGLMIYSTQRNLCLFTKPENHRFVLPKSGIFAENFLQIFIVSRIFGEIHDSKSLRCRFGREEMFFLILK